MAMKNARDKHGRYENRYLLFELKEAGYLVRLTVPPLRLSTVTGIFSTALHNPAHFYGAKSRDVSYFHSFRIVLLFAGNAHIIIFHHHAGNHLCSAERDIVGALNLKLQILAAVCRHQSLVGHHGGHLF